MRKVLLVVSIFALGVVADRILVGVQAVEGQAGGAATCAAKNGDVNASGSVDLSDAVSILGNLFLGNPTTLLPLCESPTVRGLPDTGQKQCHDCSEQPTECHDCSGQPRPCRGFTQSSLTLQDAFQQTGCPNDANRFTISPADDTVTDNCTGLEWQRFTADRDGDGQITSADLFHSWCEALDYCFNLSFAGHGDWRLPSVRELESIVDYGRFNPSIDPDFGAESATYWSSTSCANDPHNAWLIFFGDGDGNQFSKNSGSHVRAVRNAP